MKSNAAVLKIVNDQPTEPALAPLVQEMLVRLGEDPRREGLAARLIGSKSPFAFSPVAIAWILGRSSTAPFSK